MNIKQLEVATGPYSPSRFTSLYFRFRGATPPGGPEPPHCQGITITLRHTTLGRTPLDEWSARRWQHTTLTIDKHACLRRFSNPESQQVIGRRSTP